MTTTNLYELADTKNIFVQFCSLPQNKSISARFNGSYFIGIDSSLATSSIEEKVKLAHEMGHCVTDSFYIIDSPLDVRGKHEFCANEWAIKKLVPKDELDSAVSNGCTEIWQLSEWFSVTYDFIDKAVYYYQSKCFE